MTLSITHLQAIAKLVDGPWVTRLIVPVLALSTWPFLSSGVKADSGLCARQAALLSSALCGAAQ